MSLMGYLRFYCVPRRVLEVLLGFFAVCDVTASPKCVRYLTRSGVLPCCMLILPGLNFATCRQGAALRNSGFNHSQHHQAAHGDVAAMSAMMRTMHVNNDFSGRASGHGASVGHGTEAGTDPGLIVHE